MTLTSPKVLTVSALTAHIKSLLETNPLLQGVTLVGEISGFKHHNPSGHLYFSLTDKGATIACVMFRREASRLAFVPESGVEVLLRGRVSLYEKTGRYQIYVDQMVPKGAGAKQLAYEALKEKLLKEGIFKTDQSRRPLPSTPSRIGIVTSPTGAVLRDMVRVLRRRWPGIHILLAPALVQGLEAPASLIQGLDTLYTRGNCDLIIIGRGGGSQEDLWCFNDEALVRKVAASPVPIISAVGHETDITLTDFAADLRAGTPSIAAELAVPDQEDLARVLGQKQKALSEAASRQLTTHQNHLVSQVRFFFFPKGRDLLAREAQNLDRAMEEMGRAKDRYLDATRKDLATKADLLEGLSPLKVLARGFSMAKKEDQILTRTSQVSPGDTFDLILQDGTIRAKVEENHGPTH